MSRTPSDEHHPSLVIALVLLAFCIVVVFIVVSCVAGVRALGY